MKIFIPEIGTQLTISQDWEFSLIAEDRNKTLALAAGFTTLWDAQAVANVQARGWRPIDANPRSYCYQQGENWFTKIFLPAGTILTVDRIYIRKGAGDFSSVSFFLNRKSVNPDFSPFAKKIAEGKGKARFWAKLEDVNQIEF